MPPLIPKLMVLPFGVFVWTCHDVVMIMLSHTLQVLVQSDENKSPLVFLHIHVELYACVAFTETTAAETVSFKTGCHVQNRYISDTACLEECGLVQTRSLIAAHCVHCTQDELALFRKYDVGVACCPLSNAYFADGCLDLTKQLTGGHAGKRKIGLGTDIAGGYCPSMLSCIRMCAAQQKGLRATKTQYATRISGSSQQGQTDHVVRDEGEHRASPGSCGSSQQGHEDQSATRTSGSPSSRHQQGGDEDEEQEVPSEQQMQSCVVLDFGIFEAFSLATSGGARVLGLEGELGCFRKGAQFDAVVLGGNGLDLELLEEVLHGGIDDGGLDDGGLDGGGLDDGRSSFDRLVFAERMLHLCDRVEEVFVGGRRVV